MTAQEFQLEIDALYTMLPRGDLTNDEYQLAVARLMDTYHKERVSPAEY